MFVFRIQPYKFTFVREECGSSHRHPCLLVYLARYPCPPATEILHTVITAANVLSCRFPSDALEYPIHETRITFLRFDSASTFFLTFLLFLWIFLNDGGSKRNTSEAFHHKLLSVGGFESFQEICPIHRDGYDPPFRFLYREGLSQPSGVYTAHSYFKCRNRPCCRKDVFCSVLISSPKSSTLKHLLLRFSFSRK